MHKLTMNLLPAVMILIVLGGVVAIKAFNSANAFVDARQVGGTASRSDTGAAVATITNIAPAAGDLK